MKQIVEKGKKSYFFMLKDLANEKKKENTA